VDTNTAEETFFDHHELDNPMWRKFCRILREREIDHLKRNAQPLNHDDTQMIRGQLKEITYLLDLAEAPMMVDEPALEIVQESSDPDRV
jgi:hypothetical protein